MAYLPDQPPVCLYTQNLNYTSTQLISRYYHFHRHHDQPNSSLRPRQRPLPLRGHHHPYELAIPYEKIFVKTADFENLTVHEYQPERTARLSPKHYFPILLTLSNPTAAPNIEDPITGITLCESCAIIVYLLDIYDTEGKLQCLTEPGSTLPPGACTSNPQAKPILLAERFDSRVSTMRSCTPLASATLVRSSG